jgi:DNA-binding NtrC family response regulator
MTALQKLCANQSDELHTKSVLIVEDDKRSMRCLTLAMEARGFEVMNAESVFNAIVQINLRAPEYAVVDLRLGDGCGLDVISALKERQSDARAIILTGYGKYRHRSQGSQTRCRGLSHQTCGHGRYYFDPARAERSEN